MDCKKTKTFGPLSWLPFIEIKQMFFSSGGVIFNVPTVRLQRIQFFESTVRFSMLPFYALCSEYNIPSITELIQSLLLGIHTNPTAFCPHSETSKLLESASSMPLLKRQSPI